MAAGATTAGSAGDRKLGLDFLRCVAISLVVIDHWSTMHGPIWPIPVAWATYLGTLGVELFFSLSGFLIGGVLLDQAARSAPHFPLGRFWWRRWLRTLPAFYVYFAFLCFMFGWIDWPTAFFVQRFYPQSQRFFAVAWSLAMEEWFYLLLPLIVFAAASTFRKFPMRLHIGAVAAAIILICSFTRLELVHLRVHSAWVGELSLVTHPILRLDCCAYGVLLAMIVRGDPNRVRAWFSRWWVGVAAFCLFPLILLGVILMTLLRHAGDQQMLESIYFPDWGTSYYALQFSVIDFVMAVIVVGFSFIEIRLPAMIRGFVTEMSRTSYSLYLLHTLINYFILAWIMAFFGPILGPIAYIALLGGGSWLSYRAIERPFLRVRDLWSEQVRARSQLAESLPSATGSAR